MAINNGNGLAYKNDVQTWSVYELHVSGVVVLEAAIDNSDPELKIFVGRRGATFAQVQLGLEGQLFETKGRAQNWVHAVGGDETTAPDAIVQQIDGYTVQRYIYPRALRFVTQLYVAQLTVPEEAEESESTPEQPAS